jgi:hypothetical protein
LPGEVVVAVAVLVAVDPCDSPWCLPGPLVGLVVGVLVARAVWEVEVFFARLRVGGRTVTCGRTLANRVACSSAAAEMTVPMRAAVAAPLGRGRNELPSSRSGVALVLTADGDPARTVTPGPLALSPAAVIAAAATASNQYASIGRAWFAFTSTLSRGVEPTRANWLVVGLPRPRPRLGCS